jgi:Ca2+/Na+ antiporter
VGVLFGASVASLSLGCGSVAVTAEQRIEAPPGWRRVWPFVVVVAVLGMLAGLSGTFTVSHAAIFLVEGIVLWLIWEDRPALKEAGVAPARRVRPVLLALAIGLAVVGAWAAARGAVDLGKGARAVTLGTVAATMMAPMLVLPMLGTGTMLAARGMGGVAVTSQVGVVLLNLCLWLPVVIGGTYWQAAHVEKVAATQPSTQPTTQAVEDPTEGAREMVFPVIVWRVDTVVLLVLGMILLPAAIGRWTLGRRDGVVMLFVYVAYLMVVAAAGRR